MSNYNIKTLQKIESKTKIYLIIIAVILLVLCINNLLYVIPSIIVYVGIIFYTIWVYNKRKGELSSYIDDLTFTVDSAAKNTLINSPFPLIIIETDGNVIWKSPKFVSEFENINIENILNDLIQEIKAEIQGKIENYDRNRTKDRQVQKELVIEDKHYKILGEYVKSKQNTKTNESEYMVLLYFIDNTEYVKAIKKYNDAQTCIGIIMVDNYEELLQRISNEKRPEILAKIEKTIYDWAEQTKGVVIKSERDTFVYVFEQRYLEKVKENRFQILDTVKEIKLEGTLQITLSISISNEGATEYEKYKSALAGMDIALGRGGDQAVIRESEKYLFFGGRAQEVEKRTKVKARIVAHALEELILESKDILIMGHMNGDIDSVGSSLGIYRLAKSLGKPANIVNETSGISLDEFMKSVKKEEEEEIFLNKQEAMSKITRRNIINCSRYT